MITLVSGSLSRMRRAASMPVERGMRTSMTTTSGVISSARCTASMPSAASPTTLMSGSSESTRSRPRRNSAWSSTITTRMVSPSLMLVPARASTDRLDQAEVAISTSVDDGGVAVLGVHEQEEIVPEELHLERGLLGAHRLHREPLRLDDPVDGARLLVVLAIGGGVRHQRGIDTGRAAATTPGVRTRDALLLDAGDLVRDLVDDEIQRGGRFGGSGVRLHEVALQVHEDFTHLIVGDATVAQLGEVDLDAAGVVGELRDLGELLSSELAKLGRDVDVLPSDHDV